MSFLKNQISKLFRSKHSHPNSDNNFAFAQHLLSKTCVNTLIAKTSEGLFSFDIHDQVVGWMIALEGAWEKKETAFLKKIVKEGDLVIDVGANLGWYTVIMAKLVKENGYVMSFEPDPRNYELLQQNIYMNKVKSRVLSYQLALSNTESMIDFELSDTNFGDHRVRYITPSSDLTDKYQESSRKTISVSTKCLDRLIDEHEIFREAARPIKLMKIDTQGSEVAILSGGIKLLPRIEYLIIECWPYGLQRAGSSLESFNKIISKNYSYFFRVSELDYTNLQLKPISMLGEDMASISHFVDYVFTNKNNTKNNEWLVL